MDGGSSGWRRFVPAVLLGVTAAMAAVVLFGVPLGSVLYLGVLLLCPLMMIGMHGDHGHRGNHAHGPGDPHGADGETPSRLRK